MPSKNHDLTSNSPVPAAPQAVPTMRPNALVTCLASSMLCSSFAIARVLDPFIFGSFVGNSATYSVASELGFFVQQGLNVTLSPIPNSTFGYATLLDGGYDLLVGTVDNVVNMRFNSEKPFTVVGQLDLGPDLVIAGAPGVNSILDLKGKALMVDSPTSGYAAVVQKVLAFNGLQLGTDYTFQQVGGTATRFELLRNGTLADGTPTFGTLLTYPFKTHPPHHLTPAVQASTASPPIPILARVSDFVAPFFSNALTIRSQDADPSSSPTSPLVRAIAALLAANRFLADPDNKDCAVRAIAKDNAISRELAEQEYASATNPVSGETSQVDFDASRLGLLNVIDIRMLVDGFTGAGPSFDFVDAIQPGPGLLLDLRIRDAALKLVKEVKSGSCPLPK
ncbi:hypothetical protein EIP91_008632 [Steccherinum ochraceum]|uniref:SsuA/THI5-like domain-containing protein n=1 Tax=Steccherinum ochraceum TaxID=92696 RepID=A0A4R0RS69_9APHY|nr:hypothetical protein EIP91_008632 [Steccherinum ochraceum]